MEKKDKKQKVENGLWRAYVRITDSNIYEKLKWLEEVKKVKISNAIANALYYGLDEYIRAEFGEIEKKLIQTATGFIGKQLEL